MWIDTLEIDDHILDKIESKHGVTFDEVEDVCYSARHVRRGREGHHKVFGQTEAGRYLLVVLSYQGDGLARVVTARDMTPDERRLYRRS